MTAELPVLPNALARRLFLHKHGLCQHARDLAHVFDQLKFVQVDSINTVARAHHMIIHSRLPRYRQADLAKFVERDRKAFEHWTHDASIIAMAHYPHWKLRFERAAQTLQARWSSDRREGFLRAVPDVMARISQHGPTCSSEVGEDEMKSSGGWWDWHPSKTALEYLWHSGELAVSYRKAFRKYYDLSAQVVPQVLRDRVFSPRQTIHWACDTALDGLGFATSGEMAAYFDMITPAEAKAWCAAQLSGGQIIEINVQGHDGTLRRAFARPEVFDMAALAPTPPGQVRILSPFDPVLRDRKRAHRLFGFYYRIEIYVPAPKRQYGYYVFPVLEGDRLIGRIDMAADAKTGILAVRKFWPETGVKLGQGRMGKIVSAIERTRRLAGAEVTIFHQDWRAAPYLQ